MRMKIALYVCKNCDLAHNTGCFDTVTSPNMSQVIEDRVKCQMLRAGQKHEHAVRNLLALEEARHRLRGFDAGRTVEDRMDRGRRNRSLVLPRLGRLRPSSGASALYMGDRVPGALVRVQGPRKQGRVSRQRAVGHSPVWGGPS